MRALRQRFFRIFVEVHSALILRTRGRPEHIWFGLRCLVLETTGRRSGQARRVALLYMPDGEAFIVVASNFGSERPPAWWINLQAEPRAMVECRGQRFGIVARDLDGPEREATLARVKVYNKQWREYTASLRRTLPIVRLERT
jgi:F420H(2)-dependent quinone reductase